MEPANLLDLLVLAEHLQDLRESLLALAFQVHDLDGVAGNHEAHLAGLAIPVSYLRAEEVLFLLVPAEREVILEVDFFVV